MSTQYKVEGRCFDNGDAAEQYARMVALRDNRNVSIMEKIDDMTPWHVCAVITSEQ